MKIYVILILLIALLLVSLMAYILVVKVSKKKVVKFDMSLARIYFELNKKGWNFTNDYCTYYLFLIQAYCLREYGHAAFDEPFVIDYPNLILRPLLEKTPFKKFKKEILKQEQDSGYNKAIDYILDNFVTLDIGTLNESVMSYPFIIKKLIAQDELGIRGLIFIKVEDIKSFFTSEQIAEFTPNEVILKWYDEMDIYTEKDRAQTRFFREVRKSEVDKDKENKRKM